MAGWSEFRDQGKLADEERVRKLGLLVVDDETEIVASLRDVFQRTFDIYHSSSSPDALELFKEHGPKIILSDQRMPDLSGLELLRKIKEINPDTVRILVTGYSDINVVVAALNEGLVWKYVAKPWVHEELRKIVVEGARWYLKEHNLDEKQFGSFLGF